MKRLLPVALLAVALTTACGPAIDLTTGLRIEGLSTGWRNAGFGMSSAFAKIGFSNSWAGPIAFTEDAVPLLGIAPSCERILVAGAYAGHGVALSVRAGELLANAIVRNEALPAWGTLNR